MEFWLRSGILEKPEIWNLMLMPEMKLSEHREFSSQALLLIGFRIPGFSDRFLRVTRIPYPVSPVYSIREKLLLIPAFPKQTFSSQFLIKPNQKGALTAKTTVEQDSARPELF